MIKISHINGDEKYVTQGAFESIFKPLGYKLVAEKENKEIKTELTGEKKEEVKTFEKPKEETKSFQSKDKRK